MRGARIVADHADHSGVVSGNADFRCASALSIGCRLSGGRPSGPGSRDGGPEAAERLDVDERIPARDAWRRAGSSPPRCGAAGSRGPSSGNCEQTSVGVGCWPSTCSRSSGARLRTSPGFASSGARPRLSERYFTISRASAGSIWRLVQRHHPPDGFLPAFRRGAPVRDARHPPLVVRGLWQAPHASSPSGS